jgi:TRAP-type C4-dicarboxylate transport system permease small subunit
MQLPQQGTAQRIAEKAAVLAAVVGGVLIFIVAALVTTSVVGRWLFNKPVPADYEFVEIGVGVAVFAFLSYTQLRSGHIAVDTFTQRLPRRANAVIDGIWDLLLAGFLAFFTWGLVSGTQESWQYGETLVQMPTLPIWPVYAVCAVLCALACLIALFVALRKMAGRA